jgi:type IV secretion system protein TrbB
MDMKPPPKIERRKAPNDYQGRDRRKTPHHYKRPADVSNDRLLQALKTALGPIISAALDDPDVTEVMVSNSDSRIWIDSRSAGSRDAGVMEPSAVLAVVNIAAHACNKVVTEHSPSISAELPGSGLRFQGAIPPQGPRAGFVIRTKPRVVFSLDDYVASGTLSPAFRDAIGAAICHPDPTTRPNIAVVGATSSGKTTFVNACLLEAAEFAPDEHILTIEDTLELQNSARRRTEFRTVLPGAGGGGRTIGDCVVDAMRCTPVRMVIGEVRDRAALDMLEAWHTGHRGGLTTWHADSAEESLPRLHHMATGHPKVAFAAPDYIPKMIAGAIDMVIYMMKDELGQRRVTDVMWLDGYEDGRYVTRHVGG